MFAGDIGGVESWPRYRCRHGSDGWGYNPDLFCKARDRQVNGDEENAQGRFHSGLSFQLLKLDLRQNVLAKLSADGDGFKSLGRRLAAGGFDGFDTKLDALENAVHKDASPKYGLLREILPSSHLTNSPLMLPWPLRITALIVRAGSGSVVLLARLTRVMFSSGIGSLANGVSNVILPSAMLTILPLMLSSLAKRMKSWSPCCSVTLLPPGILPFHSERPIWLRVTGLSSWW